MRRLSSALISTKPQRLAFAPELARELAAPRNRAMAHMATLAAIAAAVLWFAG